VDGAGETPGLTATYNDLIPPDLLQEMARTAKLAPLVHPADAPVERGYTPSVALADYIRCRDLTCRFPGCDQPATDCDIDHTIPHGRNGPIHASNLKSLCRKHHLLKTFWGWHDEQLPDATVIWTSPAGDRYITTPGSAILFPTLATPTVRLAPTRTTADDRAAPATAMMPTRRRTRAQNRARRIDKERLLNRQDREVARSREWWEQTLRIATAEPPPF
jgi:hypothetical protein